jgi:hypothetical protein
MADGSLAFLQAGFLIGPFQATVHARIVHTSPDASYASSTPYVVYIGPMLRAGALKSASACG